MSKGNTPPANLDTIATDLDNAEVNAAETPQIDAELSLEEAYQIQKRILAKHLKRGEIHNGIKLGFTSKAKMEQMGIDEIIIGFLTDAMAHEEGTPLTLEGNIHPRIEPELVFKLHANADAITARDGESTESLADRVRDAVTHVALGVEVIDSRYKNFKFNLADVIADNTSASKYIHGPWQEFPRELRGLAMEFVIDGEVVESATSDAILGDPNECFTQIANMMQTYGIEIPAGATILAGSMSPAHWLKPGQKIVTRLEGFEPLTVDVA